jgi:hypothetical protein
LNFIIVVVAAVMVVVVIVIVVVIVVVYINTALCATFTNGWTSHPSQSSRSKPSSAA